MDLLSANVCNLYEAYTDYSQENSLSYSPRFCKFERNTTCDWLNHIVCQSEVVLLSNTSKYRNIWRVTRQRTF